MAFHKKLEFFNMEIINYAFLKRQKLKKRNSGNLNLKINFLADSLQRRV